ncbi:hypothetical protein LCGC14_0899830 [marine sediment metagenome]|uniref:Uncharacterized protein n=1 Tax=marine sediment metagenome TaxID=412755 RepID=A0A0F9S3P4_9ZZZZ
MNEIRRLAEEDRDKSAMLLDPRRGAPKAQVRGISPAKFEADEKDFEKLVAHIYCPTLLAGSKNTMVLFVLINICDILIKIIE